MSDTQLTPSPIEVQKTKIVDFIWLINGKLFQKQQLAEGEHKLLIIGYNPDFSNMRITYVQNDDNLFQPLGNVNNHLTPKENITIALYPETIYQIVSMVNKMYGGVDVPEVLNFERCISNKWSSDYITTIKVEMNLGVEEITLKTVSRLTNNPHLFVLSGWQTKAFTDICNMLISKDNLMEMITRKYYGK